MPEIGSLTDLRVSGVYLPSILLLYLHQATGADRYLTLALLTAVAGVWAHGATRATFGIGGPEENPEEKTVALQRFQVAIWGKGPARKFPDTLAETLPFYISSLPSSNPIRILFVLFGAASVVILPYSTYVTLTDLSGMLGELNPIVSLLFFAEVIWIIQFFIFDRFTSAYLTEQDPEKYYEGLDESGSATDTEPSAESTASN